jgi:hypothetical protein
MLVKSIYRGAPLPIEQALQVGSEIANALDKAHRRGITRPFTSSPTGSTICARA